MNMPLWKFIAYHSSFIAAQAHNQNRLYITVLATMLKGQVVYKDKVHSHHYP